MENTKEIVVNQKGTKMVTDGKGWRRLDIRPQLFKSWITLSTG